MATTIYVDNKSTCVSDSDVQLMVNACNILLPAVSRAWGLKSYQAQFLSIPATGNVNWIFHIIDTNPNKYPML